MRIASALLMTAALVLSSLIILAPSVKASPFSDHDLDSITIPSGDYHAVDLGTILAGKEISVTYFASAEIDGLLLTDSQYQSWIGGGTGITRAGSDLDGTLAMYTYTVENDDHFWYVLDNSNQNSGGANGGLESTISTGGINIGSSLTDGIQTRIMLVPGGTFSYDLGNVQVGKRIELSVICDDWVFNEVDTFVVSGTNSGAFAAGSDVWNRNASYLDTCFQSWTYETELTDSWTIHIENGPRGEASQTTQALQIDINFWTRGALPTEITWNTRMIETAESWRVDLGNRQSGDTLTFGLSLDGLLTRVDMLIMEESQADLFLSGQSATVLGHPSLINVDFVDMWDYRFPVEGRYSMIIDNTPEPQGGVNQGAPVHVEFQVIETTILSEWLGWYESRHFVEGGSFVSFDLGQLAAGDGFGYSVSGKSHGSGFMNSFDVLVFTDTEYQSYVSGSGGSPIDSFSSLNKWIGAFDNFTVVDPDWYWIVIDAADGPTGGANSNGNWTFDFMITSDGSISSPQAENEHYEMTATNLGRNVPEQITDGGGDEQPDDSGESDFDYDGLTNENDDDDDNDGIPDIADFRPTYPDDVENRVSIVVTDSRVKISLNYISSSAAVMQLATIVDALSDGSGYIDSETEKDSMEVALCASPAPLADLSSTTFTFTEWIRNVTIGGFQATPSTDSCSWADRRTMPTLSILETAQLKVEYEFDLQGISQPFTLVLPNISWTHPLFLPYNSPFSINCVNEVANTDCAEIEHWYPLSGALSFRIDNSGTSLGGDTSDSGLTDLGEAKQDGGLGPVISGCCAVLLIALGGLFFIRRRSNNLRNMPYNPNETMYLHQQPTAVAQVGYPVGSAALPVPAAPAPAVTPYQQVSVDYAQIAGPPGSVDPFASQRLIPSFEYLPPGGIWDRTQGVVYIEPNGTRWQQQADGSFRTI